MASSIFVAAVETGTGREAVVATLMKLMQDKGCKVSLFRPVAEKPGTDNAVCTFAEALELIEAGKQTQFLERVLQKYNEIAAGCDFVVCAGTEYAFAPAVFEADLNFTMAATLDSPLALVLDGAGKGESLAVAAKSLLALIAGREQDVSAVFVANAEKVCCAKGECCCTVPVFASATSEFMVDAAFAEKLLARKSVRVNPMMFEYRLLEQARKHKMRIVLPEGEEERILRAAEALTQRGVADIILLGDEAAIKAKIKTLGLNMGALSIQNPLISPKFEEYAQSYAEFRKAKGVTIEQAREKMRDATYFGSMMVKKDDADGMVSGSINTTAHTIRPAFEFIKTKPGFANVSSVFLMCMKDRVLVFGDCAVTPNPTPEQLAEIAVASAHTAKVFGVEPRVAMLSYSTGTSGKGPDVDLVIEATKLARERAPELAIEGPIQYDAAMVPAVAKTKLPNSPVAGKATVFIFPDLNTGNNTYKAVQRAANAIAIGPVLQGLNKPVNDLSRGCLVPDIINTVAITAIQAQAEKGLL